jgi:hypothetical protein
MCPIVVPNSVLGRAGEDHILASERARLITGDRTDFAPGKTNLPCGPIFPDHLSWSALRQLVQFWREPVWGKG